MKIGYARVSTVDQNTNSQRDALKLAGRGPLAFGSPISRRFSGLRLPIFLSGFVVFYRAVEKRLKTLAAPGKAIPAPARKNKNICVSLHSSCDNTLGDDE